MRGTLARAHALLGKVGEEIERCSSRTGRGADDEADENVEIDDRADETDEIDHTDRARLTRVMQRVRAWHCATGPGAASTARSICDFVLNCADGSVACDGDEIVGYSSDEDPRQPSNGDADDDFAAPPAGGEVRGGQGTGGGADHDGTIGAALEDTGNTDGRPTARVRLPRRAKSSTGLAAATSSSGQAAAIVRPVVDRRPSLHRQAKRPSRPFDDEVVVAGGVASGRGALPPSRPLGKKRQRLAGAARCTASDSFPLKPLGGDKARAMLSQQKEFKRAYEARRCSAEGVRWRNVALLHPSGVVEVVQKRGFGTGQPFVALQRTGSNVATPVVTFSTASLFSGWRGGLRQHVPHQPHSHPVYASTCAPPGLSPDTRYFTTRALPHDTSRHAISRHARAPSSSASSHDTNAPRRRRVLIVDGFGDGGGVRSHGRDVGHDRQRRTSGSGAAGEAARG